MTEIDNVGVLEPRSKNNSLKDKSLAIYIMEYVSRVDENGELIPNFKAVSAVVDTPVATLKNWWSKRGEIKKQTGETLAPVIAEVLNTKIQMQLIRILDEVLERGTSSLSNKELLAYLKEFFNMSRLTENKSTSNIAVGVGYAHDHIKLPRKI